MPTTLSFSDTALPALELAAQQATPSVKLDPTAGRVTLRGESYPENSPEFYRPIIDWVRHYLARQTSPLHIELELSYVNTGSIKCLMDLFDECEAAHQRGQAVSVAWRHHADNPRVREAAEEFRDELSLPFEISADAD
ncbi:SiaC family regulatory phosphoprotein [Chitinasiproducens palmae]|uniref:SiaC family regulatory phosphoprotein domain-containing protein n=1 Tax=Chitinasiproducens palmae TaxID=1770053 RepID=A0A1H2PU98_9BURK|nr:SiaC family regulatory phosphoprotein [Chitinasiproducens palmae]SDV49900.1 protein of unknown function [Chitinasiproducens palmae]